MGTHEQEIAAIEEELDLGGVPEAEDVRWLCRNLRGALAEIDQTALEIHKLCNWSGWLFRRWAAYECELEEQWGYPRLREDGE